ncbi:MBL fold metallo-hydrolase [Paeniglutamicibacter kerguelensis]|uniref:Glyoxylase-like metal-dependent hydrolase (Beta-lactamase superfamily II) n=1 Tax=Paeniglutamicibacter kerguelensis TaxID=254788 RepID=A0ABS4XDC9_9MICC|nr:MBL fold metallo-hydrolase [Paeniglutamicibacter kerguelensis]MBP2386477.1 glyoxylase-like metal-dependent hydrolase (beta-lactamase superfamily II) [Paeniglutamicibacter kerguelensis]
MSEIFHDLNDVTVRGISVSEMANNVYLVTSKADGAQLLIDAADDAKAITGLIQSASSDAEVPTSLAGIATTHQHWDHIRALQEMVDSTGVKTYAGAEDAAGILEGSSVKIDAPLGHGDKVFVGSTVLECVHLRGHTPGSIAFVLRDSGGTVLIFSGDSLFPGGVGNTGNDSQRFTSLLDDVTERLFGHYPDESIVLTGHGDSTTLGRERPHLEEWRSRGW